MSTLASHLRRARFALPILLITVALTGCGSDDDPVDPAGGSGNEDTWVAMPVSQDTYIQASNADQNYGDSTMLRLGQDTHAFLQFDLQALHTNAVITGARLKLTQTDSPADPPAQSGMVEVILVTDDNWSEDSASANEPPAMGSAVLGSFWVDELDADQRAIVFNSTPALEATQREQLYENRVITLRLSSDRLLWFVSSDATETALRPSLELTYEDGMRVTMMPVADAWVSSGQPEENMNDTGTLEVNRQSYRTFVKFDLATLPADAQVHMARFKMLAQSGYAYGGDGKVYSYLVNDDSWTPETITAANEPTVGSGSCGDWWLWYNHEPRDSWGVNDSPLLRPVVQGEAAGDGVLSLRLNSPGYRTTYYRTAVEDVAKRPVLEVVYTR